MQKAICQKMANAPSLTATALTSFNIPKIKKTTFKDSIQPVNINSRDVQSMLREISKNCLDINFCKSIDVLEVSMVHNVNLMSQYINKRTELKDAGRSMQTLNDQLGFLVTCPIDKLKLAKEGLSTKPMKYNRLGKGECGVYLTRFFDVETKHAWMQGSSTVEVFVFKYIVGKCKSVNLANIYGKSHDMEPTPNYDSHVCSTLPNLSDCTFAQMARSSIYLYEYTEECLPSQSPRHCLPFAIMKLKRKRQPETSVHQVNILKDRPHISASGKAAAPNTKCDKSVSLNLKPLLSATSEFTAAASSLLSSKTGHTSRHSAESNSKEPVVTTNRQHTSSSHKVFKRIQTVNTREEQNKVDVCVDKNKCEHTSKSKLETKGPHHTKIDKKVKLPAPGTTLPLSEVKTQYLQRLDAAKGKIEAEESSKMSEYLKLIPPTTPGSTIPPKNTSASCLAKISHSAVKKPHVSKVSTLMPAGHNALSHVGRHSHKVHRDPRHLSHSDPRFQTRLKELVTNSVNLKSSDSRAHNFFTAISISNRIDPRRASASATVGNYSGKVAANISHLSSQRTDPRFVKEPQLFCLDRNTATNNTVSRHNLKGVNSAPTVKTIDTHKTVKRKISYSEYKKSRFRGQSSDSISNGSNTKDDGLHAKVGTQSVHSLEQATVSMKDCHVQNSHTELTQSLPNLHIKTKLPKYGTHAHENKISRCHAHSRTSKPDRDLEIQMSGHCKLSNLPSSAHSELRRDSHLAVIDGNIAGKKVLAHMYPESEPVQVLHLGESEDCGVQIVSSLGMDERVTVKQFEQNCSSSGFKLRKYAKKKQVSLLVVTPNPGSDALGSNGKEAAKTYTDRNCNIKTDNILPHESYEAKSHHDRVASEIKDTDKPVASPSSTSVIDNYEMLIPNLLRNDHVLTLDNENIQSSEHMSNSFVEEVEHKQNLQYTHFRQSCHVEFIKQVNPSLEKPLPKSISMRDAGIECYLLALGDMNYQPFAIVVDYQKKRKHKVDCKVCNAFQERDMIQIQSFTGTKYQTSVATPQFDIAANVKSKLSEEYSNDSSSLLLTRITETSLCDEDLSMIVEDDCNYEFSPLVDDRTMNTFNNVNTVEHRSSATSELETSQMKSSASFSNSSKEDYFTGVEIYCSTVEPSRPVISESFLKSQSHNGSTDQSDTSLIYKHLFVNSSSSVGQIQPSPKKPDAIALESILSFSENINTETDDRLCNSPSSLDQEQSSLKMSDVIALESILSFSENVNTETDDILCNSPSSLDQEQSSLKMSDVIALESILSFSENVNTETNDRFCNSSSSLDQEQPSPKMSDVISPESILSFSENVNTETNDRFCNSSSSVNQGQPSLKMSDVISPESILSFSENVNTETNDRFCNSSSSVNQGQPSLKMSDVISPESILSFSENVNTETNDRLCNSILPSSKCVKDGPSNLNVHTDTTEIALKSSQTTINIQKCFPEIENNIDLSDEESFREYLLEETYNLKQAAKRKTIQKHNFRFKIASWLEKLKVVNSKIKQMDMKAANNLNMRTFSALKDVSSSQKLDILIDRKADKYKQINHRSRNKSRSKLKDKPNPEESTSISQTKIWDMLNHCSKLKDKSNPEETTSLSPMEGRDMLDHCSKLEAKANPEETSSLSSMECRDMFNHCSKLKDKLNPEETASLSSMEGRDMLDHCSKLEAKANPEETSSLSRMERRDMTSDATHAISLSMLPITCIQQTVNNLDVSLTSAEHEHCARTEASRNEDIFLIENNNITTTFQEKSDNLEQSSHSIKEKKLSESESKALPSAQAEVENIQFSQILSKDSTSLTDPCLMLAPEISLEPSQNTSHDSASLEVNNHMLSLSAAGTAQLATTTQSLISDVQITCLLSTQEQDAKIMSDTVLISDQHETNTISDLPKCVTNSKYLSISKRSDAISSSENVIADQRSCAKDCSNSSVDLHKTKADVQMKPDNNCFLVKLFLDKVKECSVTKKHLNDEFIDFQKEIGCLDMQTKQSSDPASLEKEAGASQDPNAVLVKNISCVPCTSVFTETVGSCTNISSPSCSHSKDKSVAIQSDDIDCNVQSEQSSSPMENLKESLNVAVNHSDFNTAGAHNIEQYFTLIQNEPSSTITRNFKEILNVAVNHSNVTTAGAHNIEQYFTMVQNEPSSSTMRNLKEILNVAVNHSNCITAGTQNIEQYFTLSAEVPKTEPLTIMRSAKAVPAIGLNPKSIPACIDVDLLETARTSVEDRQANFLYDSLSNNVGQSDLTRTRARINVQEPYHVMNYGTQIAANESLGESVTTSNHDVTQDQRSFWEIEGHQNPSRHVRYPFHYNGRLHHSFPQQFSIEDPLYNLSAQSDRVHTYKNTIIQQSLAENHSLPNFSSTNTDNVQTEQDSECDKLNPSFWMSSNSCDVSNISGLGFVTSGIPGIDTVAIVRNDGENEQSEPAVSTPNKKLCSFDPKSIWPEMYDSPHMDQTIFHKNRCMSILNSLKSNSPNETRFSRIIAENCRVDDQQNVNFNVSQFKQNTSVNMNQIFNIADVSSSYRSYLHQNTTSSSSNRSQDVLFEKESSELADLLFVHLSNAIKIASSPKAADQGSKNSLSVLMQVKDTLTTRNVKTLEIQTGNYETERQLESGMPLSDNVRTSDSSVITSDTSAQLGCSHTDAEIQACSLSEPHTLPVSEIDQRNKPYPEDRNSIEALELKLHEQRKSPVTSRSTSEEGIIKTSRSTSSMSSHSTETSPKKLNLSHAKTSNYSYRDTRSRSSVPGYRSRSGSSSESEPLERNNQTCHPDLMFTNSFSEESKASTRCRKRKFSDGECSGSSSSEQSSHSTMQKSNSYSRDTKSPTSGTRSMLPKIRRSDISRKCDSKPGALKNDIEAVSSTLSCHTNDSDALSECSTKFKINSGGKIYLADVPLSVLSYARSKILKEISKLHKHCSEDLTSSTQISDSHNSSLERTPSISKGSDKHGFSKQHTQLLAAENLELEDISIFDNKDLKVLSDDETLNNNSSSDKRKKRQHRDSTNKNTESSKHLRTTVNEEQLTKSLNSVISNELNPGRTVKLHNTYMRTLTGKLSNKRESFPNLRISILAPEDMVCVNNDTKHLRHNKNTVIDKHKDESHCLSPTNTSTVSDTPINSISKIVSETVVKKRYFETEQNCASKEKMKEEDLEGGSKNTRIESGGKVLSNVVNELKKFKPDCDINSDAVGLDTTIQRHSSVTINADIVDDFGTKPMLVTTSSSSDMVFSSGSAMTKIYKNVKKSSQTPLKQSKISKMKTKCLKQKNKKTCGTSGTENKVLVTVQKNRSFPKCIKTTPNKKEENQKSVKYEKVQNNTEGKHDPMHGCVSVCQEMKDKTVAKNKNTLCPAEIKNKSGCLYKSRDANRDRLKHSSTERKRDRSSSSSTEDDRRKSMQLKAKRRRTNNQDNCRNDTYLKTRERSRYPSPYLSSYSSDRSLSSDRSSSSYSQDSRSPQRYRNDKIVRKSSSATYYSPHYRRRSLSTSPPTPSPPPRFTSPSKQNNYASRRMYQESTPPDRNYESCSRYQVQSPRRFRRKDTFSSDNHKYSGNSTCSELDYYSSRNNNDRPWTKLFQSSKSRTLHPIDIFYSVANMSTQNQIPGTESFPVNKKNRDDNQVLQNNKTIFDCSQTPEQQKDNSQVNSIMGRMLAKRISQGEKVVERNRVLYRKTPRNISSKLNQHRSAQSVSAHAQHTIVHNVTVKDLIISHLGISNINDIEQYLPYPLNMVLSNPHFSEQERKIKSQETIFDCLRHLNIPLPVLHSIEPEINTFGNPPVEERLEHFSDEQILLEVNVIKQCQITLEHQQRRKLFSSSSLDTANQLQKINLRKVSLLAKINEAKSLEVRSPHSISTEMLSKFESELMAVTLEQQTCNEKSIRETELEELAPRTFSGEDLPKDLQVPVHDFIFTIPKGAMSKEKAVSLKDSLEVALHKIVELFKCCDFGREHFRIPELLLLEEEKYELYSRGHCFLVLNNPLPRNVFIHLLTLKNKIETLRQDMEKCREEKCESSRQLIKERASLLLNHVGNITQERAIKLRTLYKQLLDCQEYIRSVIGSDGLTQLPLFYSYILAVRYQNITLTTELYNPSIPEYFD